MRWIGGCLVQVPLAPLPRDQDDGGRIHNSQFFLNYLVILILVEYPKSRQLQMQIIDQGEGMSSATLAKCCDPFFTTKETGQGMGLGLFLADSVIKRVGGSLRYESELGVGTKATVKFPIQP